MIGADRWQSLQLEFLRYRLGEEDATRRVFTEFQRVLRGYFFNRTLSERDSDNLTQATLMKIHLSRDRFDSRRSLKSWVFAIANHCLIDHWRGLKNEPEEEVFADDREASTEDLDPLERAEMTDELTRVFKKLKPVDRTILYLYAVEELSMAEISEVVSLSEGTVKVRAHRGYQMARKLLSSHQGVK